MDKRIFSLFSIVVIMTACSRKDVNIMDDRGLTGSWLWTKTDGGIGNHIHETPQSTKRNVELTLTADNKYVIYINGNLTSQGTYAVETRRCIHDNTGKQFLDFSLSSDKDMMVESLSSETLELSDESHDGLISLYGRKSSE